MLGYICIMENENENMTEYEKEMALYAVCNRNFEGLISELRNRTLGFSDELALKEYMRTMYELGTKEGVRMNNRKAGSTRTITKAISSAENGKLGGRPKGKK